jgi:hypothetical protein
MSRRRSRMSVELPPLLVCLIQAAEKHGEDAEGRELAGVAKALRDFADLALWAVPIHGVFVANNNDVSVIVERIAKAHLRLDEARRELRDALKVIEQFEQRDQIESACNHLRNVSEDAYFHVGLAFGITLSDLS